MPDADWPPIAKLIPHAHDSILIDRILTHDAKRTRVSVRVGSRPMLRRGDGSVPAWLAIEYMAQAIAAHEGMLCWSEGRQIPIGYLINATSIELRTARFEATETLSVSSERLRGRPGLGVLLHRCAIFRDGEGPDALPVAEGSLSIALEREGQ